MEDEQNLLPVNPEDITGLNSADARQAMQFMTTASDYLTENLVCEFSVFKWQGRRRRKEKRR